MRAALWGVALGCLAPATTALVIQSGLGAPGVTLGRDLDVWFCFLYLPIAMAVAAALQALHPNTYRRNLTAAVSVIGAVTLVKLRIHGEAVTDSAWRDAWLTVNGSLVLHVVVIWALLRTAVRDLARFPMPAPEPVEPIDDLPAGHRRDVALLGMALQAVVWGVVIGATAGGAAGTTLVPLLGTVSGAYVGAIYGLVPTAVGTLLLVVVVAWRREHRIPELRRTIGTTLGVVGAGSMAWAWLFLRAYLTPSDSVGSLLPLWLLVLGVVWPLLGVTAERLTNTYVRLSLGRQERAVLAA